MRAAGGQSRQVDAGHAVAVRARYQARPGRRAIVVTDLADLRGPVRGTVMLPLWLCWSGPSPVFDLGDPLAREELHPVLRAARAAPA